jgi:GNAT superfamily N-acetyltransferase
MVSIRPAVPGDAARLLELRLASILQLASRDLSGVPLVEWASRVTLADMERRIQEMDVWVSEVRDRDPERVAAAATIVGWMAVDGDRLEGLYTDPRFERRGIGTALLIAAEDLARSRGGVVLRAEVSRNAEEFYRRQGFVPEGPALPHGAQPVVKRLSAGFEPPR